MGFARESLVLMAPLTERSIEHIGLGSEIMAFSEAGAPETARVIGTQSYANHPVIRVNGGTLVTRDQMFFAETHPNGFEFVPAEELHLRQNVMGIEGEKIQIETIEDAGEIRDVFDLTVEGLHTYFANGYRVHNGGAA